MYGALRHAMESGRGVGSVLNPGLPSSFPGERAVRRVGVWNAVPAELEVIQAGTLREQPRALVAVEQFARAERVEPEAVGWHVLQEQLLEEHRRRCRRPAGRDTPRIFRARAGRAATCTIADPTSPAIDDARCRRGFCGARHTVGVPSKTRAGGAQQTPTLDAVMRI